MICPVMSYRNNNVPLVDCKHSECAWWEFNLGMCAILVQASELGRQIDRLESGVLSSD